MYQTSQCGGGYCGGGSQLEYMASSSSYSGNSLSDTHQYSSSGNTFYSTSSPQAHDDMFVPSPVYSSGIESVVSHIYDPNQNYNFMKVEQNYNFQPASFLKPGKGSKFVGDAEDVQEHVEQTFEKMFDKPFPDNIKVSVVNQEKFSKLTTSSGTIGLSINRMKDGLLSEIFILNDSLGRVMLTIGHELGHVLTETLDNPHDEEAKAYAFSLEWMRIIKENDIAGLGESIITENPADNGLHNVAFNFVHQLIQTGKNVWEVYLELINRVLSVNLDQFGI